MPDPTLLELLQADDKNWEDWEGPIPHYETSEEERSQGSPRYLPVHDPRKFRVKKPYRIDYEKWAGEMTDLYRGDPTMYPNRYARDVGNISRSLHGDTSVKISPESRESLRSGLLPAKSGIPVAFTPEEMKINLDRRSRSPHLREEQDVDYGVWKAGNTGVDVPFPVVSLEDEIDPPNSLLGALMGYDKSDPDPRTGSGRVPEWQKVVHRINEDVGSMTGGQRGGVAQQLGRGGMAALEGYEENVARPFRAQTGDALNYYGTPLGYFDDSEESYAERRKRLRQRFEHELSIPQEMMLDPANVLELGWMARAGKAIGLTGRTGMSYGDAGQMIDHLKYMEGLKPRGGGRLLQGSPGGLPEGSPGGLPEGSPGGLFIGPPMDPGRRRILAGGLAAAVGGGLVKGLGRAQGVGDIPKLRPYEAMEAVQRRWHNTVSAPGGFGADPRSLISEDLRLADEALTGRGKGLTYDPQLQIEHNLDELGIHPEYGDTLPETVNPLRLGQGHAPLTESKIQQVVESAENEQERRALMRFLETNWIPHQEGELGRHEQTLRDLLQGRTKRPKTIAEQQRLESLGDTHFENLTPREQIKLKFADRRSAKERRDISKQTLGDLMRGGPHAVRDARASDARLNNLLRYDRPHEVGTHELSEAVPAMGTELVNPNSPVFSQPMLDNLNAVRMKHNEEAFDVIQKYKSKGGDPFEMAIELKQLQQTHGTTLVDSLVDDAVGMMEKRMHALDPKKYAGMHPEDAQELRFNLEQVVQPYGNPAQMGTFYAGDVPKHYPVTPPPAPAPAGSFEAVEPPLIKWIKKRKRGK